MEILDASERTSAGKDMNPMVVITDAKGKEVMLPGGKRPAEYKLEQKSLVNVTDGQSIEIGDVLARIPKESSKTRDITGGLPRVATLGSPPVISLVLEDSLGILARTSPISID